MNKIKPLIPAAPSQPFCIGAPSENLSERINLFWSRIGSGREEISRYEIFPDFSFKLVFRFSSFKPCRMVLIGPVTEKTTIEIDESSDYFGVCYQPGWYPDLSRTPLPELIDSPVDLTVFQNRSVTGLGREMAGLTTHQARQNLMEKLLEGMRYRSTDSISAAAIKLIEKPADPLHMSDIAHRIGTRRRRLERRFNRNIGISPKKIQCMLRLRRVLKALFEGRFKNLCILAADQGYSDQAHMNRDFKNLTGHSPGDSILFEPKPLSGSPRTRFVYRFKK